MVLREASVPLMNFFIAFCTSAAETGEFFNLSTSLSSASRAAVNLSASTIALIPKRPGLPGL